MNGATYADKGRYSEMNGKRIIRILSLLESMHEKIRVWEARGGRIRVMYQECAQDGLLAVADNATIENTQQTAAKG